jgi:hypothetical protein
MTAFVAQLSSLDARMLRAPDPSRERSPKQIGQRAGCAPDVALSALQRLRVLALEHHPQQGSGAAN